MVISPQNLKLMDVFLPKPEQHAATCWFGSFQKPAAMDKPSHVDNEPPHQHQKKEIKT